MSMPWTNTSTERSSLHALRREGADQLPSECPTLLAMTTPIRGGERSAAVNEWGAQRALIHLTKIQQTLPVPLLPKATMFPHHRLTVVVPKSPMSQ